MIPRLLTICMIAGEQSGEQLGAALMRALAGQYAGELQFRGVGGEAMTAAGLVSAFSIDELAIIGFAAIPRRLPLLLRRIRQTATLIIQESPDVLVIIDSPEFTHRVARRVRAQAPSIPILNYVSPSVWAWRPGRARAMRSYVDEVLATLPFEQEVHERLGGPRCSYVGHPLIERIGELRPNPADMRRREREPYLVLVLPGSRRSETRRLLVPFAAAIARLTERVGAIECVLPTLPGLANELREATRGWPQPPRVVDDPGEKYASFRQARAALAASGTVTLELALAGVPMVAGYRVTPFEAAIARRLITVPSVILPNLVLGENVVPEFLQAECEPVTMAEALIPLLLSTAARGRQIEAFARLETLLTVGGAKPSDAAAQRVLAAAGVLNPNDPPLRSEL